MSCDVLTIKESETPERGDRAGAAVAPAPILAAEKNEGYEDE